jgi:hypothetical protein
MLNPNKKTAPAEFDKTRIPWQFSQDRRDPQSLEELQEVLHCGLNPIYFIHNYCYTQNPVKGRVPMKLYPFQRTVLKMFLLHIFNVVLKPRQMGLSWLVALFALWFAMFRPDKTVVILSIKKDTAERFIDKIKYAYQHLPPWLKTAVKHENMSTIIFENNSRIMSVPTSEEAGRSEGLSLLIIDEAAFVRWIGKIWGAIFPTLSTGGMCIAISTANGLGNWFADKWRDAMSGISEFYAIRLHWKMHPDRDDAWYKRQRRELGPALTAQEVDCDFLNSGRPVFDTSILVAWSEYLRLRKPLKMRYNPDEADELDGIYGKKAEGLYIYAYPKTDRHYIIGVDVATGDASDFGAIQVVDYETGEQCAEMRILCKPNQLAQFAYAIGKEYSYGQIIVDRIGVGLAVVQKLIDSHYPNLYTYMKEEATLNKEATSQQLTTEDTLLVGFTTTAVNRPVMISMGEELVREWDLTRGNGIPEDQLLINGLRTLNEMLVFNHQETGKPNPRANEGYNDDLVMAWFQAQEFDACPFQLVPWHTLYLMYEEQL